MLLNFSEWLHFFLSLLRTPVFHPQRVTFKTFIKEQNSSFLHRLLILFVLYIFCCLWFAIKTILWEEEACRGSSPLLCCPAGAHLFRKCRESSHSHDLCQPWWINSEREQKDSLKPFNHHRLRRSRLPLKQLRTNAVTSLCQLFLWSKKVSKRSE